MEAFTTELEGLLKQVTGGDTARLQTATSTLSTKYFTQVQCIPALFEIITRQTDAPVRQLAAVELRKQVKKQDGAWWESLDVNVRTQIKNTILQVVLAEPSKPVRNQLARVVSEIANIEIPKERWNDLLSFLYTCCQSTDAGHREIGVYCIDALFEVIADMFLDRIPQFFELFSKTLVDPESLQVRLTTLMALGKLAEYVDPDGHAEIKAFRDLLPGMVAVVQQLVANGDEDDAVRGMEVFDSLLLLESPLVSRHMPQLVEFFVGIGGNKDNAPKVRVAALSFLMWSAVYQKNKISKAKLVTPLIASVFPIISEEDDADDDEEDNPGRVALQLINSLSTNLPPQQIFPDCMRHVVQYMQNPDPNARKAAMLTFGSLVDGCAEHMRSQINDLLPLLFTGLQDPEGIVRKAACLALSSLAEELAEEIAEHHATLMPLILNLLNDPNEKIQRSSCNALDAILEGLGDEIMPYLPTLMEKLIFLVDNAAQTVKGVAIASIGSAAHSAGDSFLTYFQEVMPRLKYCISLQQKEVFDLKGLATDTVSAVAEAVGKEAFRPHLNEIMTIVLQGLELNDSRLRECSYVFFAVVARVYEEEFAPFLPVIIPQLLKSCNEEEKLPTEWEDEEDEDISLEADEAEEDLRAAFSVSSAIAEEKECAVDALGHICAATRSAFMPYVETSVEVSIKLLAHHHEDVRKSAVDALFAFMLTMHKMTNPPKWVPGLPLQIPIDPVVAGLVKLSMDAMIVLLDNEEDRSVVAQTFSELTDALQQMGPAVLADRLQSLAENVLLVLQKEHKCQFDMEAQDIETAEAPGTPLRRGAVPDDDDEQAEYDAILINNAADLVGTLAKSLGPDFAPFFQNYLPLITKYYKKTRPTSDRSLATGVIAECAFGLKKGVTPFTMDILQLVMKALGDEEDEVKSNAAYAIGVLVENSDMDLSSYYMQILQSLRPMFDTHGKIAGNLADNASGAVCRMIMKNPSLIPLDQVLPVVLDNLPLKKDYEENEPVYRCILHLVRTNNPLLLQNMPKLLNIFAQALSPPEGQLKDNTRAEILELLTTLKTHHLESFQTMVAGMDPAHAQSLAVLLQ
ncbi:armadillo-type protein [Fimicolochytrium jonesii]|uniref:armadillo-type protein n=1 Tax=Fimicolochytrium jonesii TaxID=1396493 RepID=UPI0022FEB951|nr:armadillo-type protein [Fimicolochytrium jonesii]KAI8824519.1 armadillo-type protein [Fimicolochytrium jonesii]